MKFRVFRTSDYDCCYPPCEGAVLISHELKYKSGNYEIYKNKYEIEINSIDDLVRFIESYGGIIVGKHTIEIYDGYRE